MSLTPHKSSQVDIARATKWNREHKERHREISKKNYWKDRTPRPVETPHERFERLYVPVPESGCWLWLGATDKNGYGKVKVERRHRRAHQWAWELFKGYIPDSICVLHRCDVPGCVNPDHLFLGTHQDNATDKVLKDRHLRGIRNPSAILTESDVAAIVRMKGMATSRVIAEKFGVSRAHISKILAGKIWKHIMEEQAQL